MIYSERRMMASERMANILGEKNVTREEEENEMKSFVLVFFFCKILEKESCIHTPIHYEL